MQLIHFNPPRFMFLVAVAFLAIALRVGPAHATTPAELLEKGIYTEETVGDLEAAIAVYEKVLAESKAAAAPAAEAQFRIAVCYEKQGKTEQATNAFKAVITEYPTAEDLVRQAKSRLNTDPKLIAVPWGEGDELQMELKLQAGLSVGVQVWRVAKSILNNQPVWECNAWQVLTINSQKSKSQVFANLETFAPIQSTWRHSLLGEANATYEPGQIAIQLASNPNPTNLKVEGAHFDNEQAAAVFRRLPLKVGYKSTLNVVSTLGGGVVPLELEVKKTETVEVPAGKFDCFRLELNIGQTFWISNDEHRYIVKFDAGGVSASLIGVNPLHLGKHTPFKTAAFETVLPPDWITFTPSDLANQNLKVTVLIDPLAQLDTRIEVEPLDSIRAKHDSPVAWLQSHVDRIAKQLTGFKTISGGVREFKIGDRKAARVGMTFEEAGKVMKAHRISVFGDTSAVSVRFAGNEDDVNRLTPVAESIVEQLTVK